MIPKPQTKWRWIIAGYLFLAGLGAGAYVTGVVADWMGGDWEPLAKIGVVLGFPCVFVGCGLLILDLGAPKNMWRAFLKPGTSWMARGTIIISLFMIVSFIHAVFWVWPLAGLDQAVGLRTLISIVGAILAICTAIYTGILLGASRPIAFWSTAMLPLLFLVSALSTGAMAVILAGTLTGVPHAGAMAMLTRVDILLIILEVFVLLFFFQATHRVPESRASAQIVLTGSVAPLFWFGVALMGLLAPLCIELWSIFVAHGSGGGAAAAVLASICGIVGGLFLRQVVLAGGIHAPLKAGRFEYGVPMV